MGTKQHLQQLAYESKIGRDFAANNEDLKFWMDSSNEKFFFLELLVVKSRCEEFGPPLDVPTVRSATGLSRLYY